MLLILSYFLCIALNFAAKGIYLNLFVVHVLLLFLYIYLFICIALNDALKEEIQHLKVLTGQGMANGGPMMMNFGPSFGAGQQFYPNNHAMHTLLTAHQLQQLQLHSQKPQQPFQQHQQHPFQLQSQQQQQRPPLQPWEQRLHQAGDSKLRSSLSASALNEHASDSSTSMKDWDEMESSLFCPNSR